MDIRKAVNKGLAIRGMKLPDLYKKVGIAQSTMSTLLENNASTLNTLSRIADALGFKLSQFVAMGEEVDTIEEAINATRERRIVAERLSEQFTNIVIDELSKRDMRPQEVN